MRIRAIASIIVIALTLGCKSKEENMDVSAQKNISLTSSAFQDGAAIPEKYSSYGANISPPLSWSKLPDGTKSEVLVVEDPDAPSGTFVHWLIYNIPADATSIPEGSLPPQSLIGQNSTGNAEYFGPKPPSGTHHYHFKLFALKDNLSLPSGASKDEVMKAMAGRTLGEGEIVATYSH